VPGGFYTAADYVKHSHPMATSLALLAWSIVEFKTGYQSQVRGCTAAVAQSNSSMFSGPYLLLLEL